MHLITYISDYVGTKDTLHHDLEMITAIAKIKNPKHSITGVLFYMHDKFLQIIEGEELELRQLVSNIQNDKRNENLEILIDTPIEQRGFNDWNMDSFDFSNGTKFNHETMRNLSKSFLDNLLPRSDVLVFYYKKLLEAAEA